MSESKTTNTYRLVLVVGIVLSVLAASLALHPRWRSSLRQKFNVPFRKVLSTAKGDLLGDGVPFHVVKVRTEKGLFVEVYRQGEEGARSLLDQIMLPDQMDGYFHFRGQATNLALDDLNGDQVLEILAPSFDEHLSARLNVYSYNPELQKFEPLR